jgi:hypothetical protein
MNQKLRDKRMAEYSVVNSYADDTLHTKEEIDDRVLNWIEDMLNKYSDNSTFDNQL